MAKKNVVAVVNKAADSVHEKSHTVGVVAAGVALVAFGLSFISDVVGALTDSDDICTCGCECECVGEIEAE